MMKIKNNNKNYSLQMHLSTEDANCYFPKQSKFQIKMRYTFADQFCKGKRVIEIGPGTGYGSEILIKNSKTYEAIEISNENIHKFSKSYPNTKITHQNISYLDSLIEKKDCIVSLANIYYFNFKELVKLANKTLDTDGKLVFCTTNPLNSGFNKEKNTTKYYNIYELNEILGNLNFYPRFYGYILNYGSKSKLNFFIKFLRFLLPEKIIFYLKILMGKLEKLPSNLDLVKIDLDELTKIDDLEKSNDFLLLYCVANKV